MAQSEGATTSTSARLVDGRRGRLPWAPGRAALIVGAPLAAVVVAGGSLYGVNRIQDDLGDGTRSDLDAAGIVIQDLDIDFEHRDGAIRGVLPDGVTADQVREAVNVDGIRVLDLSGLQSAAPGSEPEPDAEPAPPEPDPQSVDTESEAAEPADQQSPDTEPADQQSPDTEPSVSSPADAVAVAATGPTAVTAEIEAGAIALSGEVLTEEQRDLLVETATVRFGSDNVTDELVVSGNDEATPGGDGRIAALAGVIGAMVDGFDGAGTLTDTGLDLSGTAPDDASVAAMDAAMGAAATAGGAIETTMSLDVGSSDSVDAEITALQADLDSLEDEIRRNVVFERGEWVLSTQARATLDKAAASMTEYERPVVEVTGHTDDDGTAAFNEKLSGQRAASVVDYLVSQGVDPDRVRSIGAGESTPIADNGTEDGRALNRRVEFVALESFE